MSYEQKYLKYKQKYQELKKHLGKNVSELETEKYTEMPDFNLSDTPTGTVVEPKMMGGADMPETETMDFDLSDTPTGTLVGGTVLVPAPYVPTAPLASCAGQVNPMPNINVPMAMQNKNVVNHDDNATELSEIQNTDDIVKLFSQYGGKHKDSSSSESSRSSSTTTSTDSDISTSDSF